MTTVGDHVRERAIATAVVARDEDETGLLTDAAELIITSGLGSRQMLVRKLRIGWELSGRLLDELEAAGVVGPDVGDPRDVLVKPEDLETALELLREATEAEAEPVSLRKPTAAPPPEPVVGTELEPRTVNVPIEPPTAELDEATPNARPRVLLEAVQRGGAHVVHTLWKGEALPVRTVRRFGRYWYVSGQGVASWLRRGTNAANHNGSREQLRMARAAQPLADPDAALKWMTFIEKQRDHRSARMKDLPAVIKGQVTAVLAFVVMLGFVGLLVGAAAWVAWGSTGWGYYWWSIRVVILVLANLLVICTWLVFVLTPFVTVWSAHREGKRVADPPRWLLSLDERRCEDALITPARLVMALRDCGIPELRRFIKEDPDGGGGMIGLIEPAGCGVQADVTPPPTVPTNRIQEKRRSIAEAIDRFPHELYMTIVGPRTLRFWVADPGELDQPIGPSPLVGADVIKVNMKTDAAPWGQNLLGDVVGVKLWEKHLLITGLSNHGKTTSARALLLWLAFDVRVEFRIGNLKGGPDWDCFEGLASVYIKGPTDEHVAQVTEMLEDVVAEMVRRQDSETPPGGWDPLITVVDEAQVAFMSLAADVDKRPYGGAKNTSRFFLACKRILDTGRYVNVLLHLYTQDPTNQNLPVIIREAMLVRVCLVVGKEEKSKMALGDAAVEGGAAPHLLRRDYDKGMVVMHGGVDLPRGESSITLRTFFIDDAPAWKLANKAIEKRRRSGRTPLVIDAAPMVINSLQDIHDVMQGQDRVLTLDVLSRLKEHHPAVYEDWTDRDLADTVREYKHLGLDRRKRGAGQMYLLLEEVQHALRESQ